MPELPIPSNIVDLPTGKPRLPAPPPTSPANFLLAAADLKRTEKAKP